MHVHEDITQPVSTLSIFQQIHAQTLNCSQAEDIKTEGRVCKQTHTDRQRHRHAQTHTDTQTKTQTKTQTDTDLDTDTDTTTDKDTHVDGGDAVARPYVRLVLEALSYYCLRL